MPQGFDSTCHVPRIEENNEFSGKVIFIGYGEDSRFQYMNFLVKNGIKVHVWGNGWTNKMRNESHSNLIINSYPITGEAYARAITSASINLCFLRKLNRDTHTSRTFETSVSRFYVGGADRRAFEFFSEDTEAAYFSTKEELLERVRTI